MGAECSQTVRALYTTPFIFRKFKGQCWLFNISEKESGGKLGFMSKKRKKALKWVFCAPESVVCAPESDLVHEKIQILVHQAGGGYVVVSDLSLTHVLSF